MTRTFEQNLALYAKLAIRLGVNIQPGQELIIGADVNEAMLVRLLVDEAYEAGAKNVFVSYGDEKNSLSRLLHGSEEAIAYAPKWLYDGYEKAFESGAARLSVSSGDPGLLGKASPERVAKYSQAQAVASKPLAQFIGEFRINWNVIGAASPAWAEKVFPEVSSEEAVTKLWDAIFFTARILEDDPLQAWTDHCNLLEKKQNYLNELRLDSVRFRGPGTDLTVGLVEDHIWIGGWGHAKNGVRCSPNIPTEEIFTMPHRLRTNGTVASTKPLSVRGQIVDGISMEFNDGKAIRASAKTGEETLIRLIDTDAGARHLGEVALVSNRSKTAMADLVFQNTLYDENASCHIALGRSYSENLEGIDELTADEQLARGSNDSLIHVDWMVGSAEVEVDGIRFDGSTVALLRDGDWV